MMCKKLIMVLKFKFHIFSFPKKGSSACELDLMEVLEIHL
jgi:hypothetical protein